jgi:hypothetical protein
VVLHLALRALLRVLEAVEQQGLALVQELVQELVQ